MKENRPCLGSPGKNRQKRDIEKKSMDRRKLHRTHLRLACYLRLGTGSFGTGSRGFTENISREGGLLRIKLNGIGDRVPRVGEYVEALFELPHDGIAQAGRCIHCFATVAWTARSGEDEHLIGIRIERMRFEDFPTELKKRARAEAAGAGSHLM